MYDCSDEVKDLFKKRYRQVARITVTKGGETLCVITERDIVQNGLTIDRYCNSGKNLEVATAIAAELNLRLRNKGKFDSIDFRNAELFVEIGIKKWDAHRWENAQIEYIPYGVFIVREPVRPLSIISITALDRMVLLDKTVDLTGITYPITVADIIHKCCTDCGVQTSTTLTSLLHYDLEIDDIPSTMTYRDLIKECAFLTATDAYMDHEGDLSFTWYKRVNTASQIAALPKLPPSDRYSSDIESRKIYIYGIDYKGYRFSFIDPFPDPNEEKYIIEDSGEHLLFDGLSESEKEDVITEIGVNITLRRFTPFTASIKPMPYLYPLDAVNFITTQGNRIPVQITHTTFTMNCNMNIKCDIDFPYMELT